MERKMSAEIKVPTLGERDDRHDCQVAEESG
jgi:hypothetical protein